MQCTAFCAPGALSALSARPSGAHGLLSRRARAPAAATRTRRGARMADEPETPAAAAAGDDEPAAVTSASGILKSMREEAAATERVVPDESSPRGLLGITRDQDGKSNVWAVEPTMAVDDKPQISKGAILAAVFACVFVALLVLPNLPFTNGDQF